jgi:hypothetical protein
VPGDPDGALKLCRASRLWQRVGANDAAMTVVVHDNAADLRRTPADGASAGVSQAPDRDHSGHQLDASRIRPQRPPRPADEASLRADAPDLADLSSIALRGRRPISRPFAAPSPPPRAPRPAPYAAP